MTRRRSGAVAAIVAAINAPIVIVAVRLWRRFTPWVLVTRQSPCEGRPA
jgi:hypothetical protein